MSLGLHYNAHKCMHRRDDLEVISLLKLLDSIVAHCTKETL